MFARILFGFLLECMRFATTVLMDLPRSGSFKDGGLEFKQQGGSFTLVRDWPGKKVSGVPIILTPNGPSIRRFCKDCPGRSLLPINKKRWRFITLTSKVPRRLRDQVEEARNVPPSGHSSSAPATQIQFDAANKSLTVPLDDGMVVTFKNLDKKKDTDKPVVVAGGSTGAIPGQTFFVKHRGASAGGGLTNACWK